MQLRRPSTPAIRILLLSALLIVGSSVNGRAQTAIPIEPFRSLSLHNGAEVILRAGSTRRVTVKSGTAECTTVAVEGGRLVIESTHPCPERHRLVIEVVTPEIDEIAVSDGGTVRTAGEFASQGEIVARVENGGTIDMRSIPVESVRASVHQGGRILTRAEGALIADVAHGGVIVYWGSPKLQPSIDHGGTVTRGKTADFAKPLDDVGLAPPPPVPPVTPVPPVPPVGG